MIEISEHLHTRYWNVSSGISSISKRHILEAAAFLAGGRLVAFPTETVYGLGADALHPEAVEKIFLAKGRPQDNPLIVHVAYFRQARRLVREMPEKAGALARRFWPGPLTMVLPKNPVIPDVVTAGLDTVAIRLPGHPVARELIRLSGCPVAAPSANISGKPSPTTARHVLKDMYGKIDGVLDGGEARVGLESTVVDLTGRVPVLLRPGGITREQLEEIVGQVEVDPNLQNYDEAVDTPPRSPGMKYVHYAPAGKVFLVEGEPDKAARWIRKQYASLCAQGIKTAVLCSRETEPLYQDSGRCPGFVQVLGSRDDLESVARHLYAALRRCDLENIEMIFIEAYSAQGMGMAVMNRMYKASGSNVVRV